MQKQNITYDAFKQAREQRSITSNEYIPISLSQKGRLYAPKLFHIKNFTVEEVLDLALSEVEELPNKVLSFLSTKVWEKDVDLGKFSKEEYIETIFNFFKIFYTSSIKQHDYIPQESDYTYLQNMNGGPTSPEYLKILSDLKNEIWKPKFNLDLDNVQMYELPDNFIKRAEWGSKSGVGFKYAYGIPSYRDLRDIEDFIQIIFKEESKRLGSVEKLINLRNDQLKRRLNGEDIPVNSIPPIPRNLETQYNDFIYRRQLMYTQAIRAAYLKEYNGKDVSDLPIEERIKLASDPRIDLRTYMDFINKTSSQKLGLKKEVKIISPITNSPVLYDYSLDALIALRPFEAENLLELIVSLSKNTANSYHDIMSMQMDQALALHNTLANLAEKERAESEKQKDEQMSSANSMMKPANLGMSGVQSQMNRMTSGLNMSSLTSSMNNFKF